MPTAAGSARVSSARRNRSGSSNARAPTKRSAVSNRVDERNVVAFAVDPHRDRLGLVATSDNSTLPFAMRPAAARRWSLRPVVGIRCSYRWKRSSGAFRRAEYDARIRARRRRASVRRHSAPCSAAAPRIVSSTLPVRGASYRSGANSIAKSRRAPQRQFRGYPVYTNRFAPLANAPTMARRTMAHFSWLSNTDARNEPAHVLAGRRVHGNADVADRHEGVIAPIKRRASATIRSALGTYAFSSGGLNGTGAKGAPTRPTGASR